MTSSAALFLETAISGSSPISLSPSSAASSPPATHSPSFSPLSRPAEVDSITTTTTTLQHERLQREAKLAPSNSPQHASSVTLPALSLLIPAFAEHETSPARTAQHPSDRAERAGSIIDVERWTSDSESEELEMDSYHGATSDDEEVALTASDRRKARQIRRGIRHRAGDESEEALISGEESDGSLTKEERKEADGKVLRGLAINLLLIGLWYLFSLLISVYNKWMFSPDHLNFRFPLFTTCVHMIVQFSLSSLVLYALPQFRPVGVFGKQIQPDESQVGVVTEGPESSWGDWFSFNTSGEERKKMQQGFMTKWVYLTKIAPCGAATGLDIGLGNMSLKYITLAFYTMCKSSSLAFVLVFAFAFRLEKVTWKLIAIISVMTLGVVMMVASEAQFVAIGFLLVLLASALSGLRWSLTQMLLLHNPATSNPFASIFFLAPCMFVSILAVAIPVEGFGPLSERLAELADKEGSWRAFGIILFPGIIAFLMVSSEFALLQRSSVVTLSICGIFKEVMTISAAAIIFNDPLTPVNISGLCVTIVSIAAYNYIKITKMRAEAIQQMHQGHHHPHSSGSAHFRGDNTTGYAVAEDSEDESASSNHQHHTSGLLFSGQDGVSNAQLSTSLENEYAGNENMILIGEPAASPARMKSPNRHHSRAEVSSSFF